MCSTGLGSPCFYMKSNVHDLDIGTCIYNNIDDATRVITDLRNIMQIISNY